MSDKNQNESKQSENKTEETNKTKLNMNEESLELYPERRGIKMKKNWFESLVSREDLNKVKCERKVSQVIEESNQSFKTL